MSQIFSHSLSVDSYSLKS